MEKREFYNIIASIIVLTVVFGFSHILKRKSYLMGQTFLFSIIIIFVVVYARKLVAHLLDMSVEHEIIKMERYSWKPSWRLEKPIPGGIILPLVFSLISLGFIKIASVLSYETKAKKYRASRRFGFYSYTEITDWHNALVGAGGIIAALLLSLVSYFLPFTGAEYLAKFSAYYAFWNMIPFWKMDGTQIFAGARVIWVSLFLISSLFAIYAILSKAAIF